MTRVVRAAGGLLIRRNRKGNLKVLIAHRPRYDDWGLPKGRADKGETPEETAIREVLEETGYDCRIVAPLPTTRHRIDKGVKEVRWFAMRALPSSPGFKKNDEIDKIQWVSRKKAREILDYENDRNLIKNGDFRLLSQTGTLHLLRHAAAGDRDNWDGEDRKRPVTKKGRKQSELLAKRLGSLEIERVLTSPYDRCVQTVKPLAKRIGAKVEVSPALAEEPDIDLAYDLIDSLVGYNAVLCTHGDVIPAVINRMIWAGLVLDSRFYCSKASIWEIGIESGRFTSGHYVKPPKL